MLLAVPRAPAVARRPVRDDGVHAAGRIDVSQQAQPVMPPPRKPRRTSRSPSPANVIPSCRTHPTRVKCATSRRPRRQRRSSLSRPRSAAEQLVRLVAKRVANVGRSRRSDRALHPGQSGAKGPKAASRGQEMRSSQSAKRRETETGSRSAGTSCVSILGRRPPRSPCSRAGR